MGPGPLSGNPPSWRGAPGDDRAVGQTSRGKCGFEEYSMRMRMR